MVIVGLLVIALICLILGLVLASSAWLLASLIATAGAGFLLWKARAAVLALHAKRAAENGSAAGGTTLGTDDEAGADRDATVAMGAPPLPAGLAGSIDDDDVWVIDGRPRYHVGSCALIQGHDAEAIPFQQATEDGFMPCSLCQPELAHASQLGG